MRWKFYSLLIGFLFCGKIFSQEQALLDSVQLEEATSYMNLQEALEHPEMVIKLDLRKQKLKTFPKEIFQFKNLQYLDLSRNQLKELPDSIGRLAQLQWLNVSHNKITSLPKEIGKCSYLFYINANNNDLFGLPPQIGNLEHLRVLDLWNNDLADFPETLSNLHELNTFDIRSILIDENTIKRLKRLMPQAAVLYDPPCNCKLQ